MFRWFRVSQLWPLVLLVLSLFAILTLMMIAIQSVEIYQSIYLYLLFSALFLFVLLASLVGYYLFILIKGIKTKRVGAKLTARLALLFGGLSVLPLLLLFSFSVNAISKGIDSWFDETLEKGFEDALTLSKIALDTKLRDALSVAQSTANTINNYPNESIPFRLEVLRAQSNAKELTVFTADSKKIIATSQQDLAKSFPDSPNPVIFSMAKQGIDYVSLEPIADALQVRVVIAFDNKYDNSKRILQAIFDIPTQYSSLGESTQKAFNQFKQFKALKAPLRVSFIMILTMVLFLALLTCFGGAFFVAMRLVKPLRTISTAIRDVSVGNYERKLQTKQNDEFGQLIDAFNEMITRLALARDEAHESSQLLETQKSYLESILAKLSSGVLVFDLSGNLRTFNQAALSILNLTEDAFKDLNVYHTAHNENIQVLTETIGKYLTGNEGDWRTEIPRFIDGKRQILSIRGANKKGQLGLNGGLVVVFDDITQVIVTEREAAWGEVARRLAHEIKNPLTPIQLSAERLQMKLHAALNEKDAQLLQKSTHTIIAQVAAMKDMVDAFSQYARPPKIILKKLHLNKLIQDVMYFYLESEKLHIALMLNAMNDIVMIDEGRIRQLIHNLVKNAIEACTEHLALKVELSEHTPSPCDISVRTESLNDSQEIRLIIQDNGPGFAPDIAEEAFEPYVSTKAKGSGLGLAIVRKIVEEHSGTIGIKSTPSQGAIITIRLPLAAP